MSAPPDWIEERIEDDLHNKLTQRHVVEVMLAAERPFFSVTQLQARLKPEVTKATIRNRLDELRERDVVATEAYPDSITLYYLNHPESNWPISPAGKRALDGNAAEYDLSLREFLTFSNSADIRTLVLAGFQMTLLLIGLGIVLSIVGVFELVHSDQQLFETASILFTVSLVVLCVEKVVRRIREQRNGDTGPGAQYTTTTEPHQP